MSMGSDEGNMESIRTASCHPVTLKFEDIYYRVKFQSKGGGVISGMGHKPDMGVIQERTVLNGITGVARPGEILAVLGPSGSGKSTLLNVLAGRLRPGSYTGSVLANGQDVAKPVWRRRTGFVTQDDVLYPRLTVRETLVYCALLRLPKTLNAGDKAKAAEAVIEELGLAKCASTIVGNGFVRGVSGGERKRVSIGHEMLVNPSLLLLDEPTSGLDSTAAHRLMSILAGMAAKGKTVVTSVHQPSSRVYQMFDSVLLLSEGSCVYFGKGCNAMAYFATVGFSPSFPVNPADFMLDLANGIGQVDNQVDGSEKLNIKQSLMTSYNAALAPVVKASIASDTYAKDQLFKSTKGEEDLKGSLDKSSIGWFNQFTILLRRDLKERRHEAFNSLKVFQVFAAAILAGAMWWRSDIRDVHDRLGLLFFISIFWGVFPSFNAVFTFPQDRAIFIKERASGMYSLSSYFVARLVGDLPMELILPTVFGILCYWMAGLRPDTEAFLQTLAILLSYVLVAQGLGLALGAAIMDAKQASTVVTVTMLAFLLTGGFYVNKVPSCMQWVKYTSFTFYCYKLLIMVQYGPQQADQMIGCGHHDTADKAECRFIEDGIGPTGCACALLIMFVGYRLLAYLALRRMKA